jgi:hypothetical protein
MLGLLLQLGWWRMDPSWQLRITDTTKPALQAVVRL